MGDGRRRWDDGRFSDDDGAPTTDIAPPPIIASAPLSPLTADPLLRRRRPPVAPPHRPAKRRSSGLRSRGKTPEIKGGAPRRRARKGRAGDEGQKCDFRPRRRGGSPDKPCRGSQEVTREEESCRRPPDGDGKKRLRLTEGAARRPIEGEKTASREIEISSSSTTCKELVTRQQDRRSAFERRGFKTDDHLDEGGQGGRHCHRSAP
mmetsp:Transcript_25469/g.47441  ORF Transcript_25469/g.47441 Transcript_25469/m.47441 type:complete len:206 (+) Transcript_25469:843-1460(+)